MVLLPVINADLAKLGFLNWLQRAVIRYLTWFETEMTTTTPFDSNQPPELTAFVINGNTFHAEDCINGVLINPKLPDRFEVTPNEDRPVNQRKWWYQPFICTNSVEQEDRWHSERTDEYAAERLAEWQEHGRAQWLEAWPSGKSYEVRCLDGGAWDRSTSWGMFGTLADALQCVTRRLK